MSIDGPVVNVAPGFAPLLECRVTIHWMGGTRRATAGLVGRLRMCLLDEPTSALDAAGQEAGEPGNQLDDEGTALPRARLAQGLALRRSPDGPRGVALLPRRRDEV